MQSLLRVSVDQTDFYILTNYDIIQLEDTTIIENPNSGGYLLQIWKIKCNDEKNNVKIKNFIKSTEKSNISFRGNKFTANRW